MGKYVPRWHHWLDSSALTGLASGVYWVLLGIIGIAPVTQSDLKWSLLAGGVFLSLLSWYALARASEKAEESDRRIGVLLRELAASSALAPQIVQQNDVTHSLLLQLHQLYEGRKAIRATVGMAVSSSSETGSDASLRVAPPSMAGSGSVTITPGTGELVIEGFAPTISVKALDKEIREKEDGLLRYLERVRAGPPSRMA